MSGLLYWIKALGSVFILCAGAFGGRLAAGRLELELDELSRFEHALLSLSTEISYSLSTLPKALINTGNKVGGHTGALFFSMGKLSGMEQRRTVKEAFALAKERVEHNSLPKQQLQILDALVKNLGVWGCEEQVRFINISLNDVRTHRAAIQQEHLKKAKMYRTLGFLFALGVVIVLL